jgi:hypothetical protein
LVESMRINVLYVFGHRKMLCIWGTLTSDVVGHIHRCLFQGVRCCVCWGYSRHYKSLLVSSSIPPWRIVTNRKDSATQMVTYNANCMFTILFIVQSTRTLLTEYTVDGFLSNSTQILPAIAWRGSLEIWRYKWHWKYCREMFEVFF